MATNWGVDSMATPLGILPHRAYKELVGASDFDLYRRDPRIRVATKTAFNRMQAHVVSLYEGVEAVHSFEDAAGHPVDCIPLEQQPSLRGQTGPLSDPPDLDQVIAGEKPQTVPLSQATSPPAAEPSRDRHGNVRQAPPGTIPMRRVTLNQVARFHDLDDYLNKVPTSGTGGRSRKSKVALQAGPSARRVPSVPDADAGKNHRYAYTEQNVANLGAHDTLAVYAPAIDANQFFSLAQHWYSAGTGANHQTVEVGWQVYPDHYGHSQPVLFIFWTPDNYATGSYNLDAAGFVQTNNAWTLGGAISPVSVVGGAQWEIELAAYLYNGNWWIYAGGTAAANTIGYYPGSLFGTGPMATSASAIKFGGETVTAKVSWPAMGSGGLAAAGWQQAAYQRDIFYFPTTGGAQWTGLTPQQPSPACYTLALQTPVARPWGVYFYYGGPGGGDC
jgi:hypothetical protein